MVGDVYGRGVGAGVGVFSFEDNGTLSVTFTVEVVRLDKNPRVTGSWRSPKESGDSGRPTSRSLTPDPVLSRYGTSRLDVSPRKTDSSPVEPNHGPDPNKRRKEGTT